MTDFFDISGKKYQIDESKEITRGGEGKIIKINSHQVAKLYLPGVEPISAHKFKLLHSISNPAFIKPEFLLYDNRNKIVGYVMKMVPADFFPMYSIFAPNFVKRYSISKNQILDMFKKIAEVLATLHANSVIIGDFNPFNILMNEHCEFYFIDVDSFEVPGAKHNGRLLDDIRDHLYHGEINKESDYFAFAVNLFTAMTYIHPYKGIHKKVNSFAERMIKKLSVLNTDPDLIIPKCYVPIAEPNLLSQFKRIFNNGERFLIDFDINMKVIIPYTPKQITVRHDKLTILEILNGEMIKEISHSNTMIGIITEKRLIVIELSSRGIYRFAHDRPIGNISNIFVNTKHIYAYSKTTNILTHIGNDGEPDEPVTNVDLSNVIHLRQFNNILVAITDTQMYKLRLDMFMKGNIQMTTEVVFGNGFTNINGLVQNICGTSNVFYESNNILNTVKFPMPIKDVVINKNIGIAMYIEKNKVKHTMFKLNNMNIEFSQRPVTLLNSFLVKDEQFMIIPEDDKLLFLRPTDFTDITSYTCDFVDEQSQIFNTAAGIVVVNSNSIHLINNKS